MIGNQMKKILFKFDTETISEVLHHEIPQLMINSISIVQTGWDHLVAEVNEQWIFRFPRDIKSIANIEREKKLLDYLKSRISLPIPDYRYFGTKVAFVGYPKLQGIHINQQIYTNFSIETRHHLANTLASFFTEIHHAVSKEQALAWGHAPIIRPTKEMGPLIATLPLEIQSMVKIAIAYNQKELSDEKNLVFCHQDINGDNLAYDLVINEITGVFDFSDTGIGPYSLEFAELFVVDAELAKFTADIYAKINNVPNPFVGGAVDYILRKMTFMLDAWKNSNVEREKNFLKALSDFLPIWQEVYLSAH